jgi:type I restriction enzyme S subunit
MVTDVQYGTSVKANTDKRGVPVVRMNNVTYDGLLDLTDIKWCELGPVEDAKLRLREGDLLFNRTNSPELVGKTAVWDAPGHFVFAGYLIRLRFRSTVARPDASGACSTVRGSVVST